MSALRPRPFRDRGLALLAVLIMAIGIGSFSASVVLARALLPDLPVPESERVVELARTLPSRPGSHFFLSGTRLEEIREGVSGLEAVGGLRTFPAHLTSEDGPPTRVRAAQMSSGAFRVLRVAPVLGRWLQPADEEPGAERAAVLGHELWERHFGRDRNVLGRRIEVNDRTARVVGVMPPGFAFPQVEQIWLSLDLDTAGTDARRPIRLQGIGRLAPDATVERVRAELGGLDGSADHVEGTGPTAGRLTVRPWVEMLRAEDGTAQAVPAVVAIFVLVLLVACVNVSLLFLVRALRAERSTAIRMALGASRSTVVLEQLVETLTLAAFGGALGFGLTLLWTGGMRRLAVGKFQYGVTFAVDWPAAAGTLAAVLAAAVLAGLAPALRGTDVDVGAALRERGGGSVHLGRMARFLLVAEVAFSCVVLVSVGHSLRGVTTTLRSSLIDLPVPIDRTLVARYALLERRHPDPRARTELHRRVVEALRSRPDVEAVAVADALPGVVPGFGARRRQLEIEGTEHVGEDNLAVSHVVAASPGFYSFLGLEPLRGRLPSWSDRPELQRIAVVNASFVRRFLGGQAVPGARIALGPDRWRTVVGVVGDVAMKRPDGSAHGIYLPVSEMQAEPWVMVRTSGDPMALAPAVREAIWKEDPRIPVFDLDTMEGLIYEAAGPALLLLATMLLFGSAALVMTLVGLFGLMAFSVRRRTGELAVRSALGAPPAAIGWLVVRGMGGLLGAGLVLGVTLAWWLSPHLGEALVGADPHHPLFYVVVPLVLAVGASAAGFGPVVRALQLEVTEALRVD